MGNIETARNIFGGIASITTVTYFLSPLPIVYRLVRYNQGEDETPFLVYFFTILNCSFWLNYGIVEKSWPLILTNSIGWTLNLTYLLIFIIYRRSFSKCKKIALCLTISLCLVFLILFFSLILPSDSITGTMAMVADFCMCFSPFQYVNQMYKEKNNMYLPLNISIFQGLNNIVWTTYGFLYDYDIYIILPNFIGAIFDIIQCFMWIQFYEKKSGNLFGNNENNQRNNGNGNDNIEGENDNNQNGLEIRKDDKEEIDPNESDRLIE